MKRVPFFLLLALLAAGPRPGAETPTPSRVETGMGEYEDLYRWGEYDSLIRLLEPRLSALMDSGAGSSGFGGAAATKAETARAHLAVAVAYWATGRTLEADRAFLQALRLDPDQSLDPLYSTPEMILRLETLREAERRRTGMGPSARELPPSGRNPAQGSDPPAARREKSSGWMWAGAVVATGLAAGAYFFAQDLFQGRPSGRDTLEVLIPTE